MFHEGMITFGRMFWSFWACYRLNLTFHIYKWYFSYLCSNSSFCFPSCGRVMLDRITCSKIASKKTAKTPTCSTNSLGKYYNKGKTECGIYGRGLYSETDKLDFAIFILLLFILKRFQKYTSEFNLTKK